MELHRAVCFKAIYYLKLRVCFLPGCCTPLSCGLGAVQDFRLPNVPEREFSCSACCGRTCRMQREMLRGCYKVIQPPLLWGAGWRGLRLVLAAELAVLCGCTYTTAMLLEPLLPPPVAVPRSCGCTPRPVPKLILRCLCWMIKPKTWDRSYAWISTEENLKHFSWHLMSRGKYVGKGEAAKGEMLEDYYSHSYPDEISELHDLTADRSTAQDLLHLGVVTVVLPGRRGLAGAVGQPRGVVSLCEP